MPGGGATIATYQKKEITGSKPFNGAFNGTSVDTGTGKVQLGSNLGTPAPGALTDFEEIDLAGFSVFFDIISNSLDPSGRWPAFVIGGNPFTGISGTTLNIDYTDFPVGTFGMIGHNLATEDANTTMAWFRGIDNDCFVFGNIFANASSNPAARFLMFDSGNVTLNSQVGNYPTSNDIDTGNTFGVFGGIASLDPGTSGIIAMLDAANGGGSLFSPDWATEPISWLFENTSSLAVIEGTNEAGAPYNGDFFSVRFALPTEVAIDFLNSGNMLFWNGTLGIPAADTGKLAQFNGDVDVTSPGSGLYVAEGANGRVGQAALVAGTVAIAIASVGVNSRAFVQRAVASTASLTVQYNAVCTAGTLTITAAVAAGTINVLDTSTLNYFVIN